MYNISDPEGLKFLAHLSLGLSHVNAHKFRHNLQDCLNTSHYLLHCHHFSNHLMNSDLMNQTDVVNSIKSVCHNFESMSDNVKKNILLHGDSSFDEFIIEATITYIKNGSLGLFLIDKFIKSVLLQ